MFRRLRILAAVVAVPVLITGVAVAAPGQPILMGAVNDAGTTATTLLSNGSGNAFSVTQDGTGIAVRASTKDTGSSAVFATTTNENRFTVSASNTGPTAGTGGAVSAVGGLGTGVAAATTNGSKYAVSGTNNGTAAGTGGAILGVGKMNNGLVGSTANVDRSGVRGVNTGSGDGVFGEGGNGVHGRSANAGGSGVYGENTNGGYGVAGRSNAPNGVAVFGEATGAGGTAGSFSGPVQVSGPLTAASMSVQGNLSVAGAAPFVRGRQVAGAIALQPGEFITFIEEPGVFRAAYNCPADLATNGIIRFRNLSAGDVNLFSDNGSPDPIYQAVPPNGVYDQFASKTGEFITYQFQGAVGIGTVWAMSVHRASDCHISVQALLSP